MLISVKLIKNPRIQRYCDSCEKIMYHEQLRLYGSAHSDDPKSTLYVHSDCVGYNGRQEQKKIEDALANNPATP
jgi:hypothetical protein